jgi:hypothetical protein
MTIAPGIRLSDKPPCPGRSPIGGALCVATLVWAQAKPKVGH